LTFPFFDRVARRLKHLVPGVLRVPRQIAPSLLARSPRSP